MNHIRGATFRKICTYKNASNVPQNITALNISAQVRDSSNGNLISTLVVTKTDAENGVFQLLDQTTTDWPITDAIMDIKITTGTDIIYTDSITFPILESVTA